MENIRVIKYGEHYFKYQIMPWDEDDPFMFELCLEDDSHMPFCEYDIANIEKADDKEIFTYAFNLGYKYENVIL